MGAASHRALIMIAAAAAIAFGDASASGCGGGQHPAAAPTVTLTVSSPTTCNHGRPLQAVVRAVTLKQFVEDQYRAVAQLVISPDESLLASFVVFPGVSQTVTFTPPAKGGAAAVYFLFTDAAGTSWKQQLDASTTSLRLELANDQIAQPASAH
jgi:hypothetical protein